MGKKITYESFETKGNSNFAAMYFDMLNSQAWQSLRGNSIKVYMFMRSKYKRKIVKEKIVSTNREDISISYKDTGLGQKAFEKAIDELIATGFIKVNQYKPQGGFKKIIIYGFNDQWKYYNTLRFQIKDEWKRMCNRRKV
ncbi:hypothetical protein [Clostridium felsineum]|uniref:hypothetical protein n=1 Tax=Clostridium felsineum TaxID=36839 RepID=UPI00098CBAF6|nr:hypothetical protein [Clostridium felsineum]URZ02734.1 hypothetical protein CLAUR_027580 [Clostridium felsineum]